MTTLGDKSKLPIFTKRFRTLRGERTQAEFADFLEISRPTVGFYENGERLPDAAVLARICKKCSISADWLLGQTDAKTQDLTVAAVCDYTGLTENAISTLNTMKVIPLELLKIVNLLIENISTQHDRNKSRAIVDLISLFLNYDTENARDHIIDQSGNITPYNPAVNGGYILYSQSILTSEVIEASFLRQIEQGLREMKKHYGQH